MRPLLTFDLFSALVDSRSGGSAAFADLASSRGWVISGEQLYDAWDPRNKAAQAEASRGLEGWAPWRDTARQALGEAYAALGLRDADLSGDVEALVASMPAWPLWPDVAEGLPVLAEHWRVGLLSNVDDDLFRSTAAAALVDHDVALTSQRLQAAKPGPVIYRRALERHGPLTHVATSARDVRGALEAGIPVVRLARPGHHLDPDGPAPAATVDSLAALEELLRRA